MSLLLALSILFAQGVKAEDALPKDVVAYLGLTGVDKAPGAIQTVLATYAAEGEGLKLFTEIASAVEKQFDELPKPLDKEIPKALRTVTEVHVAFTRITQDGVRGVALLRADPDVLKKLFEEHLKPFLPGSIVSGGRTILMTAEGPFGDEPAYFSVAGPWLAMALSTEDLNALLDRLAKPDRATGLASNPLHAKLGAAKDGRPELRLFMDGRGLWSSIVRGSRSGRIDFDRVDAALGFRKIEHEIVRAWVESGLLRTSHEIGVAPGCTIFDLIRMKPGEMSTLDFASAGAVGAVAARLDDAPSWRDRLKEIMTIVDENEHRTPDDGRRPGAWAELEEGMAQELGVNTSELAAAVGPEAAFIADYDDWNDFERRAKGMVYVMKVTDAAKVKKITDAMEHGRISREAGEWKTREHGGVTIRHADGEIEVQYAFVGDFLVFATGAATMDRAIDAQAKKDGMMAGDFARKLRALLPADASKFAAVNLRRIAESIETENHTGTEYHKRLRADALEFAALHETDRGLVMDSVGAGAALAVTPSLMLPMVFLRVSRMSVAMARAFPGGEPAPLAPLDLPKAAQDYAPPTDPKALEADIETFIRKLGSDDADARDEATHRLVRIGKPCIDAVAKAATTSDDPEVKARSESILLALEAYDALPVIVDRRIEEILERYKAGDEWSRFSTWETRYASDWNIEPNFKTYTIPDTDHGLLGSASAVKSIFRAASDGSAAPARRDAAVGLLALFDASPAGEAVVEAGAKETDAKLRLIWLIASGWVSGAKARAAVFDGLASTELFTRRAAFLAAERRSEPETVDKLLDLLDAADAETRWNAGFTLSRLTGGAIDVNGYEPEKDRKAAADKARAWWKDNRATFKLVRATPPAD